MEKLKQVINNPKNIPVIIILILCFLENISATLTIIHNISYYCISNIVFGIFILILTNLASKNYQVETKHIKTAVSFGFLLNIIFPAGMLIPVTILVTSSSSKKVHIIKLILETIIVLCSLEVAGACMLAIYMGIEDGASGYYSFIGTNCIINCINLPVITLLGIILGNKKSWIFYLMPIVYFLVFIIGMAALVF